jgi:uncharacterized membrane protein
MIRKMLGGHNHSLPKNAVRNYEVQRIETFSDGVFAFAVTLLIVSLEVPKSFEELMINMRGFFAFGASFLLLVFIWNEQHIFFRRYGLDDSITITLNVLLLFIVLFYVYPLKFLFTLIFSDQIYGRNNSPLKISQNQLPLLMRIYTLGYLSIYSLFLFMYLHALKMAKKLELTALEIFQCKTSFYKQLIMVIIGVMAFLLAIILPPDLSWIAGPAYVLIGPVLTIFYFMRAKIQKRLKMD